MTEHCRSCRSLISFGRGRAMFTVLRFGEAYEDFPSTHAKYPQLRQYLLYVHNPQLHAFGLYLSHYWIQFKSSTKWHWTLKTMNEQISRMQRITHSFNGRVLTD